MAIPLASVTSTPYDDTVRSLAYVRVSTADQTNGLSFEAQANAITLELNRRGWELAEVVTEARSGKDMRNRPELQRALAMLQAGDADALVVSRLDRLARSLIDLLMLMQQAEREGWVLLILSPMVDLSDPFGKCMAQMSGAFAELERALIAQRQRESVAARKAAGTYKRPRPRVAPDAEARIEHLRSEGMSLRAIARQLELEGFPPPAGRAWYAKTVARIAERAATA